MRFIDVGYATNIKSKKKTIALSDSLFFAENADFVSKNRIRMQKFNTLRFSYSAEMP